MRSLLRKVLVTGLVVVSAFTALPSAEAATNIQTTVFATFVVNGGLGDISTLPPTTPTTSCLPLPEDFALADNCHVRYNTIRAAAISSTVCEDATTNIGKTDKAPAHVGPCAFGLSGTITGHCGQNGGQMDGIYVDSLGQLYSIDVHYNSTIGAPTGGTLSMSGHVSKLSGSDAQTGLVVGNFVALPHDPLTPGQSCLDATATHWQITGTVTIMTT